MLINVCLTKWALIMVNISYRHNQKFGIIDVLIGSDLTNVDSIIKENLEKRFLGASVNIDIVDISYIMNEYNNYIAIVHYAIL